MNSVEPLRAIMVCVGYDDLLSVTLPYNRHHFSEVMVVTSDLESDDATVLIAQEHGCEVLRTARFWHRGADFNKFAALEEGLDVFGRQGWMAIMDADVLWPKELPLVGVRNQKALRPWLSTLEVGKLYGPYRRMYDPLEFGPDGELIVPPESEWPRRFLRHRQQREWAGYTQIFHASDPVLGPPPWHETDWLTAGGPDSYFQKKWDQYHKIRPQWEVLHLGPTAVNWVGRASIRLDGTIPAESEARRRRMDQMWEQRRRGWIEYPEDPFREEKIRQD
jgi:hypothetical protein